MTATMTPVASILSTKPAKSAKPSKGGKSFSDLLDFAADSIGHAIRDITDVGIPKDHPTVKELIRVADLVCALTEADTRVDAPTFTVAYTPEGKDVQPIATFEKKVNEPVASNDITMRRNDFLVELASRKNMSRNGRKVKGTFEPGAKQFIGDDYATVLDSLVHDGMIEEFKIGRGTFYRLPVKETVPVIPAPAAPTVPAPVASADEIPEAFDNGEPAAEPIAPPADDKPVKAKKTRKSKAAPKQEETSPIANASDDDKREFVAAIIDMAKQKGMVPTPDNTAPSADAIGAAFLILGKRVSALDTVKAKKAVKLIAELRGLLS
jgi:hypothetical protein